MNIADVWKVLEIQPTKDENEILTAYRTKVVTVNPEDDPEGFKLLREAYEMARSYASKEEKQENEGNVPIEEIPDEEKTEVERHMAKAMAIYKDVFKRRNPELWEQWLKDPICEDLDTSDSIREEFLAYTMGHFQYPHEVWKLFGEFFNIKEEFSSLAELFPEEYLKFIIYNSENEGFFDLSKLKTREEYEKKAPEDILSIKLDPQPGVYDPEEFEVHEDVYIKEGSFIHSYIDRIIRSLYEEYAVREEEQTPVEEKEKEIKLAIEYLKNVVANMESFKIWHPLELAGKMRALFFDGRAEEAERLARAIVYDDLLGTKNNYTEATAAYILLYGIWERDDISESEKEELFSKCEALAERVLNDNKDNIMALEVKGLIQLQRHDYEKASDTIIQALDINSRNNEAVMLLKKISSLSIDYYKQLMKEGTATTKNKMDLAWALFRTEDSEGVFEVLEQVEPDEESFYGYNNLYGRNYYNEKKYDVAWPYLVKWTEMLEKIQERQDNGEELSDKDKERLRRTAFCYYMRASCAQELENYDEAQKYYKISIDSMDKDRQDLNEMLFYLESYGKLLHSIGKYPEAMEIWNKMIGIIDRCVPAYVHRQETAYEMRDAQLVIDDYYNITREIPDYAKAYELAARVFIIYNQDKDVDEVLKRAEEAGIKSDALDMVKARHLSKKGETAEAAKLYLSIDVNIGKGDTDITDLPEFYADAAGFFMNVRDEKGNRSRLELAERFVADGRKIDKNYKRLFWVLTDLYEWTGRNAGDIYKEMLSVYPEDANIYFEYGEYLKRSEDLAGAKEKYEKCYEISPEHYAVNNRLMNIYQEKFGDSEDWDDFNKAVEFAGAQLEIKDDDYYRIERALLYIDGYKFDLALEDAKKAVEFRDDNVYAYNAAGIALMKKGRFNEAIEYFEKALEVDTDKETPNPYINLSKCYEIIKKFDKAIETLDKCEKNFGRSLSVLENYSRVYAKSRAYNTAAGYQSEIIKYYEGKKNSSGNKWYDIRILKAMFTKIELAHLAGDEKKAEQLISKDLESFLRINGYDASCLKKKISGSDAELMGDLFNDIANFYIHNERKYKIAIKYYELSLHFRTKKEAVSVKKKSIVGTTDKVIFQKFPPEEYETDKAKLDSYARMYMCYAASVFMNGDKNKSLELANRGIACIIKGFGTTEKYCDFPLERPSRVRIVALLRFFQGDIAASLSDTAKMTECYRCSFCTFESCYERFLIEARIKEMSGNIEEALALYRKAFELSPDDCEVYQAIRCLEGK